VTRVRKIGISQGPRGWSRNWRNNHGSTVYAYDPAESLETPGTIAVFVSEALETGDRGFIAYALGVAARAKGMTELARETGLSRSTLYAAFTKDGNPTLETMLRQLRAFGVALAAKPHTKAQAS
jgi:probable addiction module antidote protein